MSSKAETDTVERVVAAESVSCVELLDGGIGCAKVVAAARASAEPVPPSMGMAKTEAKTVSAAGSRRARVVQAMDWKPIVILRTGSVLPTTPFSGSSAY